MAQIILLDVTTGAWNIRVVKEDLAQSLVRQYADASEKLRSPWVVFKTSANATLAEVEAVINQCMANYVELGGFAAVE